MPPALKSTSEFSAALVEAGHRLVVVDFWAAWCGPCLKFAPTFEELSATYEEGDKARFFKVEEGPMTKDVIAQNQIKAFPSFILYLKQKEVARVSGSKGRFIYGVLIPPPFFVCSDAFPYLPFSPPLPPHPPFFCRLRAETRGS